MYSDEGLIAKATQNISLQLDGSVTANQAPNITTQYGVMPDSNFSTGVLFIKTKNSLGLNTVAYYHHDHLQTPLQATDKAGNIVWSATYNVFGQAIITTPSATELVLTIESNLRLPGQYEDTETGLHYNFNRYYDPRTYGTVQRKWSKSVVGYKGKYELHHWFTSQSFGKNNAGWNLVPLSRGFNNAMRNKGFFI